MAVTNLHLKNQLIKACKLTGAIWSAWVNIDGENRKITVDSSTSPGLDYMEAFINNEPVKTWLIASSNGQKILWSQFVRNDSIKFQRIYLFPNQISKIKLVVGSNELDKKAKELFYLISLNPPQSTYEASTIHHDMGGFDLEQDPDLKPKDGHWIDSEETFSEPIYPTGLTFDEILNHFVNVIRCDGAFLAIRRGESFRIQAAWQCLPALLGFDIQINDVPIISYMLNTHAGVILNRAEIEKQEGIPETFSIPVESWMGIPITIGQRVIGLFVFISRKPDYFKSHLLNDAFNLVNRIPYIIENAILFEEATQYLQQLALLNELATIASAVADIDQISRRVMQRLRRIFNVDWAAVYLLSPNQNSLREYGGKNESGSSIVNLGSGKLVDYVIRSGSPIRINNFVSQNKPEGIELSPLKSDSASELAAPLKYSGQIFGALSLSSNSPNAFTSQDEQLLILIASNLAGLFENMRLNRETKERAEKLQETLHQLQESQRALIQSEKMAVAGRLMASIAHEINNPLQAVQNCLHLVGRPELSQETRASYLQLANQELLRLMNTVQRMLDYYRPGSIERKPVNVNELMQKTLSLIRKQLEDCGIRLHTIFADDLPNILAVGDQLQQVFLNLMLNSSQAMVDGGDLSIQTKAINGLHNNTFIEIEFKDNGPGISIDMRSKIFEPFNSTRDDGLGLGLAVSYGIIVAHEGTLELVEDDDIGACFKITLKAI